MRGSERYKTFIEVQEF